MKNKDLVRLLFLYNPEEEVKIVHEQVVAWNEDNTPKMVGYFEAFHYEVFGSTNGIVIRVTKEKESGIDIQ